MYRCEDCDAVFEEPAEIHKPGGCYEAGYGVYSNFESHNYYPAVDYEGCPECGSDDFHELVTCDRCEEYVDEVYDTIFGSICDNCYDDLFE